RAEVISIGDELTSGQRLDTNSQWLSQRLGDLGIRVLYHTTVGDDLQANVGVFQNALARADVIVCTGGLGPTADDLTRQALAESIGVDLVLDQPSLDHIKNLFQNRGREMPESNRIQAMFPAGSQAVFNPHGSAPGIDYTHTRESGSTSRLFALPGVPAEMKEMWSESVEPAISTILGGRRRVIRHKEIKCFGVGESHLEQQLPDLIRRGRRPAVGITVSRATITLRISADGATPAECDDQILETEAIIRDCLGELVFGENHEELQHAVQRHLRQRGLSLATAEIGYRGLMADWLRDLDASCFVGGLVLRDATGVNVEGQKPAEVAQAAARQLIEQFGSDLGLVLFRPDPDCEQVQLCVVGLKEPVKRTISLSGHPDILAARSAKQALDLLRRALLDG
ncbi:MAG: molybdopterin-binding protein, partial [Pirellulaceae bacterium]|nr:molybdopterin-binding protein [Pirellulaceae bacterium]